MGASSPPATARRTLGVINIMEAGAKCDGVTNDAAAINAAITALGAAGGRIYTPPGKTVRIGVQGSYSSDSLTIPYAVRVPATVGAVEFEFGAGASWKLKDWASSADNNCVPILIGGTSGARRTAQTTIRGGLIHGNVASNRVSGTWSDFGLITTVFADGLLISNVDLRAWNAFGIHILRTCTGARLDACRVIESELCGASAGMGALMRLECNDVVVDNCLLLTDPYHGHNLMAVGNNADIGLQSRMIRITNNGMFGGTSYGVGLDGVDGCLFADNYMADGLRSGFFAIGLGHYTNTGAGGVYSSRHVMVRNNVIHNWVNGIQIHGGAGTISSVLWSEGAYLCTIQGNQILSKQDLDRTSYAAAANLFPIPQLPYGNLTFVSGTATAGAGSTLTDSGKAWTVNEWADSQVHILTGTGAGQWRKIASNTATVLTVGVAWTVQPDATSTYEIRSYVSGTATAGASGTLTDSAADWGTNSYSAGMVTIVSGAGSGQSRVITSHTATVITITGTWSTLPDATSVYAITTYNTKTLAVGIQDRGSAVQTGTTTSATANTLTTGSVFTTNSRQNYWAFITGGKGNGQMRRIVSNTTTVLTVTPNWDVTPDASSTWAVGDWPVGKNLIVGNTIDGPASCKPLQTATFNNGSKWLDNMPFGTSLANSLTDWAPAVPKAYTRGNAIYNPVGATVASPSVPATTVAQINPGASDATVYVTGGTVTVIAVDGVTMGPVAGPIRVPFGSYITLTYSVAPTWVWSWD